MTVPRWTFGLAPNAQALVLAPLIRQLTGTIVALEHDDPAVDAVIEELRKAQQQLSALEPVDPRPRVGDGATPGWRPYLDHSRDIGAFNPCFPVYELVVDEARASGTVTFPVAYEGPPGIVHGGFQALFFDCVIQHHNCDLGQAGKTVSLDVSYRRPAPILQPLRFEIERVADERRITSVGRLFLDGSELCQATMVAVAGDRSRLPAVHPRRGRP